MSQSTIEAALRTLLMEEGRVCLPGIGTLLVEAQPALVSLMEGRASPPSKYVSFNANLVTDDGRLRQESGAGEQVDAYLQSIRSNLAEDRPFNLPGIGKLYRRGRDEIRFIPGASNLSKASYGLPIVEVRPVIRKERLSPAAQGGAAAVRNRHRSTPAERAPTRATSSPKVRSLQWPWYLAGVAGILLAIFLVFRLAGTIGLLLEDEDQPLSAVPPERLNVSPSAERPAPATPPPTDARDVKPTPPPRINVAPGTPTESTAVPSPTTPQAADPPPAGENVAIIVIGLFGRERNVRKQTGRLEAAGYTPYTDKDGRNTRVGLTVRYRTDTELQRVLADVRARYTPEAFVMRVNGAERRPQ